MRRRTRPLLESGERLPFDPALLGDGTPRRRKLEVPGRDLEGRRLPRDVEGFGPVTVRGFAAGCGTRRRDRRGALDRARVGRDPLAVSADVVLVEMSEVQLERVLGPKPL